MVNLIGRDSLKCPLPTSEIHPSPWRKGPVFQKILMFLRTADGGLETNANTECSLLKRCLKAALSHTVSYR